MVPEERKTVGMLTGSKQELFERDHPVIRQLREIPELIFPDEMEKLPPSALSLKQLFTRKQMDENHVDCLILYRIAAGALHILEELSRRGICPGLIEIGDFYAELLPGSVQVYLTHPEKFQLLHYEQDYEWYPEDERLFGEQELFDKDAQRRADVRLLYKILVASAKGNVKMPPKYTEADYSELFYKALPDEWKELFQERPDCDYATMKEMLRQCIAMEESFARAARERLDEKAQKKLEEEERLSTENGGQEERQGKKTLFSMIVLLRTELEDSRIMSRMLYQLQDELETETSLSQWEWRQAFVFGNGNIAVKEFATYEPGFRCQCEQEIKDYSAGEALIIAANLMGEAMRGHQAGSPHRGRHEKGGAVPEQQEHIFRMYALADGRLKNDRVFQAALSMLNDCQRQGMEFYLLTGEDSRCEACQKLDQLMQEGTYADPSHS